MKSAATLTYERFRLLTCSHIQLQKITFITFSASLRGSSFSAAILCVAHSKSVLQSLFRDSGGEMYSYHTKVTQNITMKAFTKALGDLKVRLKQQFCLRSQVCLGGGPPSD